MRHPQIRLLLLLSCLLCSTCPANLQNHRSQAQPFTLTWTEGKCQRCRIAQQLADIDFSDAKETWGTGFLFPYHGQGSGDYIMVHSNDGGRAWKELRVSATHGGANIFAPGRAASMGFRHGSHRGMRGSPDPRRRVALESSD